MSGFEDKTEQALRPVRIQSSSTTEERLPVYTPTFSTCPRAMFVLGFFVIAPAVVLGQDFAPINATGTTAPTFTDGVDQASSIAAELSQGSLGTNVPALSSSN